MQSLHPPFWTCSNHETGLEPAIINLYFTHPTLMRLLHCAVGAEILPNPEPDSTMCYSLLAVSCNYFSGDRLGAGHEGELLSDCTPITAVPRTEASILPKGKTPGPRSIFFLERLQAVSCSWLHCLSGYCGLKYLIWKKNQCFSFRSVTAGLWGTSAPGESGDA